MMKQKVENLRAEIDIWADKILLISPQGQGREAYLTDTSTGDPVKYIDANCDCLRHNATNYERLLKEIKKEYSGALKEAILHALKYEATRRAYKRQKQWIEQLHEKELLDLKSKDGKQSKEVRELKQLLEQRSRELNALREDSHQRARAEAEKLFAELSKENTVLRKQYLAEQKRREELGKNNKSLGAYKGLFNRANRDKLALKEEVKHLRKVNQQLTKENTKLKEELFRLSEMHQQ